MPAPTDDLKTWLYTLTDRISPTCWTIEIQWRRVYGELRAYPMCPKAQTFARLAGHTTLTNFDLAQIYRLGFDIDEVPVGAIYSSR